MPNGLHQLWRQVESDPRFGKLDTDGKLTVLARFADGWREKHGNVFGLTGLENAVSQRLLNPPKEEGLVASFANQASDDFIAQMDPALFAQDPESFRPMFDTLYEQEVENGAPQRSFVGSVAGSLAQSIGQAAPVAAVASAAGPQAGGAALLIGSAAAESAKAFGYAFKQNYFSELDKGADPDKAFDTAKTAAFVTAGLTGAANLVAPVGAANKIAGGALGKTAAKLATPIAKAVNRLPGATTGGAARFVRDDVLIAGVDDVGFEALDVAQERLQGLDTSERKGGLLERMGLAFGMGSAIRGSAGAATKGFAGVRNVFEGRRFSQGLFDEENIRGIFGSIQQRMRSDERGGAGGLDLTDLRSGERLTDRITQGERDSVMRLWSIITNDTKPLDVSFVNREGEGGADAAYSSAARAISVFNGMFTWRGDKVKRVTLLHEGAHGHFDTLPDDIQVALRALYEKELETKTGILFDKDGKPRAVSDDIRNNPDPEVRFKEWYADTMAFHQDRWAKRDVDPEGGFWNNLASDFRVKAERVGRALGFGDGLNNTFRDFLDAGNRYQFDRQKGRPVRGALVAANPVALRSQQELEASGNAPAKRESYHPVLIGGGDPLNPNAKVLTPNEVNAVTRGEIVGPNSPTERTAPLVLPHSVVRQQIEEALANIETEAEARERLRVDLGVADVVAQNEAARRPGGGPTATRLRAAQNAREQLAIRPAQESPVETGQPTPPQPEPPATQPAARPTEAGATVTASPSPTAPVRLGFRSDRGDVETRRAELLTSLPAKFPKAAKYVPAAVNRALTHKALDDVVLRMEQLESTLPDTAAPRKSGQTRPKSGQTEPAPPKSGQTEPAEPLTAQAKAMRNALRERGAGASSAEEFRRKLAQARAERDIREGFESDPTPPEPEQFDLYSRRGKVDVNEVLPLSAEQVSAELRVRRSKVRTALVTEQPTRHALSDAGMAYEDATGLRFSSRIIERNENDPTSPVDVRIELFDPNDTSDDRLKLRMLASVDPLLNSFYVEIMQDKSSAFSLINQTHRALEKSMWNTASAFEMLRKNPEWVRNLADNYRGLVSAEAVARVAQDAGLSPDVPRLSPGVAIYSEAATIAQALKVNTIEGGIVGAGALGVRNKLFGETVIDNVPASAETVARISDQLRVADGAAMVNTTNPIRGDVLYSRRSDKVTEVPVNKSLWIMPDGRVVDVELEGALPDGSAFSHGIFVKQWVSARLNAGFWPDKREVELALKLDRRAKQLMEEDPTLADFDAEDVEVRSGEFESLSDDPEIQMMLEGESGENPFAGDLAYNQAAVEQGWVRVKPAAFATEKTLFADTVSGRLPAAVSKVLQESVKKNGYTLNVLRGGPANNRVAFTRPASGVQFMRMLPGQDEWKSRRSVPQDPNQPLPAPDLPTRRFADRAAEADARLREIRDRRPDIAFREPQSLDDLTDVASGKTDAQLDARLDEMLDATTESGINSLVVDGIEALRRAQDAGDNARMELVLDRLAKFGTSIGQLLRQFALFGDKIKPRNRLEIVKLWVQRDGRKLTPQMEADLKTLIDAEDAARLAHESAVKAAIANPSDRTGIKAAFVAEQAHDRAFRQMQARVRSMLPRTKVSQVPADLLTLIQGNLLTPLSTLRNVFGNYVSYPLRLASRVVGSPLDWAISKTTGRDRKIMAPSLRELGWFVQGSVRGLTKAKDAFLIGAAEDVIVGEAIRGFNPVQSFVDAFSGNLPVDPNTGRVPKRDRVAKLLEAVVGAAPEMMLRSLSALDELAKEGFRAARLAEETKLRGLERGTTEFASVELAGARNLRKGLVDEDARQAAEASALQQTYQDLSTAAKLPQAVDNALAGLGKLGPAIRFAYRVGTSVYQRTPANLFVEGLKFAMPSFGLAHAAVKAGQGDRRAAIQSAGYAMIGAMIHAAFDELVDEGVVSAGPEESDKLRRLQSETGMGYFRLNVSALQRRLSGDAAGAAFRDGDETVRLDTLGVLGFTLSLQAEQKRLAAKDPKAVPPSLMGADFHSAMTGIMASGRFAMNYTMLGGAADLLAAVERGGGAMNKWAANVWNQLTAIPVPNTLVSFARTEHDARKQTYIPNELGATMRNIGSEKVQALPLPGDLKQRVLDAMDLPANLPNRLNIWGEPMKATPEGQNPLYYHLFDVFKTQQVQSDASEALFRLHRLTGSTDMIPPDVGREVTLKGVKFAVPNDLWEKRVKAIQPLRKAVFEQYLSDPRWREMLGRRPDVALNTLSRAYAKVGQRGELLWRRDNATQLDKLRSDLTTYLGSR